MISQASHARDENILLITLGLSLVIENLAIHLFHSDPRSLETAYSINTVNILRAHITYPRALAVAGAMVCGAAIWYLMARTDLGRAIRAVAKERQGALAVGIDVQHIFAVSFGIGLACVGAAACFLLPMFYVSPHVGNSFVLVAFTVLLAFGAAMAAVPLVVRSDFLITLVTMALYSALLGISWNIHFRRAAYSHLRAHATAGGAAVVNLVSTAARSAIAGTAAYAASKAALVQLTRVLALEWAPFNVRVNAVAPAIVPTRMNEAARSDPAYVAGKLASIPLGRMVRAEEVAWSVRFLLSPAAAMITGQVLRVDGGSTLGPAAS